MGSGCSSFSQTHKYDGNNYKSQGYDDHAATTTLLLGYY